MKTEGRKYIPKINPLGDLHKKQVAFTTKKCNRLSEVTHKNQTLVAY